MITYNRMGGRTVELFMPFQHGDKDIKAIEFAPIRYDHTLKWREGQWKSMLAMMADIAGVDEALIRNIAYPDIERVMAAFVDMLPADIRESMSNIGEALERNPSMPTDAEIEAAIPREPQMSGEPPQPQPVGNGHDSDDPSAKRFEMDMPQTPEDKQFTKEELDVLGVRLE